MANFLSTEWFEQAGKDIAGVFDGDKDVEGDKVVEVVEVNKQLNGGSGRDILYGGDGDDSLNGGSGGDTLYGHDGDDSLNGGSGSDILHGDDGVDNLIGGEGKDILYGGDGDDSLNGGLGNDWLEGNDGNDVIYGGEGNDFLSGGAGDDVLTGDTGSDIFALSKGYDVITDFARSEGDRIRANYEFDPGQINVIEVGIGTILWFESGDVMKIQGATGLDVYNSIIGANEGQVVAANFEVLA